MKIYLLILLFFPTLCFSQKENKTPVSSSKPSTTDCPMWNNQNQPKGNADYYKSLRSMKPIKNKEIRNDAPEKTIPSKEKIEEVHFNPTPQNASINSSFEEKKIENTGTDTNGTGVYTIKAVEKSKKGKEKAMRKLKRQHTKRGVKIAKRQRTSCPNF